MLAYIFFRLLLFVFRFIPFFVVYGLSNVLYLILYRLVGYRRKVVRNNLALAFPEKLEEERLEIEQKFYKHLADIFIEGIKGLAMSKREAIQRYKIVNPELLHPYYDRGQSMVVVGGHYNNWEWGPLSASSQIQHQVVVLFKEIQNQRINDFIKKGRELNHTFLRSIRQTSATFETFTPKKSVFILLADQSPSNLQKAVWLDFLGRDTAFLHGPAQYAKKHNLPLLYMDCQKVKRGFYEVEVTVLCDDVLGIDEEELTKIYATKLEGIIRKQPEFWLWSHKRWKHSRK